VIGRLVEVLAAMAGIDTPDRPVELDASQLGGGYGVATAESEDAAQLLARAEGILVDPVYTAKALAGLVARVRSGELDGTSVVFWHGGGLPALFEPL
jgi:1-aminocyclopropane-1-carboxylate deaminase/D-cysteine desulfhydrase-like pyridoxal-dependent ACC family enzyme